MSEKENKTPASSGQDIAALVEAARRKMAEAQSPVTAEPEEKTKEPAPAPTVVAEPEEKEADTPEKPEEKEPVPAVPAEDAPVPSTEKIRGFKQNTELKPVQGQEKPATLREQEEGIRGNSMNRYYRKMKSRKRKPKNEGFLRFLLIFAAVLLLLGALCTVAAWRLVKSGSRNTAETQIRALIAENDADGWKQYLRSNYIQYAPAYARASDVAYKVLSPNFSVGNVTYYADVRDGNSVYALFSDGKHFADVYFTKEDGFLSRNETVERVAFDLSYFGTVQFTRVTVYVPVGAELTVNGEKIGADTAVAVRSSAVYPGVSRGERQGTVLSDTYEFDNLYYVPEFAATLQGKSLELHADEAAGFYWFEYPSEMTHSITVTVPAEVDAYVGDALLDETWAKKELIDGELGTLDDGGTGTLPKLAVWTVDGLFGETDVRAGMEGTALALLSAENNTYVFETPEVCTYTLTVLCPAGCTVKINGKDLPQSAQVSAAAISDFTDGATVYGSFSLSGLDTAGGTVPAFEKTVVTGYLAKPNIAVYSGATLLSPAGETADKYRLKTEYDISSSAVLAADSGAIAAAEGFLELYLNFLCDGGTEDDPANRERMDRNHAALMSGAIDGSAAYFRLMDAYRELRSAKVYAAHAQEVPTVTDVFRYTDNCVCLTLSTRVTCTNTLPEKPEETEEPEENEEQEETEEPEEPMPRIPVLERPDDEMSATLQVLCVKTANGWYVWDYRISTTAVILIESDII